MSLVFNARFDLLNRRILCGDYMTSNTPKLVAKERQKGVLVPGFSFLRADLIQPASTILAEFLGRLTIRSTAELHRDFEPVLITASTTFSRCTSKREHHYS